MEGRAPLSLIRGKVAPCPILLAPRVLLRSPCLRTIVEYHNGEGKQGEFSTIWKIPLICGKLQSQILSSNPVRGGNLRLALGNAPENWVFYVL